MRSVDAVTGDDPPRLVSLIDDSGDAIIDIDGVSLEGALEWLTSRGPLQQPDRSLLSWGLRFWTERLLFSAPLALRLTLTSGQMTRFGEWKLTYVSGKFLEIRRLKRLWRVYEFGGMFPRGQTFSAIMARWNVGSALAQWGSPSEALRGPLADAIARSRDRARAICELGTRVMAALDRIDLTPSRWHGVGSIGSRIIRDAGFQKQIARYAPDRQPEGRGGEPLLPVFLSAYYGGRAETTAAGTFDIPVYRYDLRSAYAWALSHMAPVGFEWEWADRFRESYDDRMSVWYVEWDLLDSEPLGPFPFRTLDGGPVSYPLNGRGWYWWPEVRAALRSWGGSSVRVLGGYVSPRSRRRPLSGEIARRWEQRRELDRRADPAADLLKTGLAAVYGRLAQRESADGLPGRFYNPALAGWVCSAIRGRILDAVRGNERAIVGIATDAVVSAHPLPEASVSANLGGWRLDSWSECSYVLPGIYRLRSPGPDGYTREEVALSGLQNVSFDWLLDELSHYGQADVPARWFVPNILADALPDQYEESRCQWVDSTVNVRPIRRLSFRRTEPEALIGLDWRTESAGVGSPYRFRQVRDSGLANIPPAWRGQTDPVMLAVLSEQRR